MAARCVGVMSKIATIETMHIFLEKVLPWLGAINDSTKQEGAIEALACILSRLNALVILPYLNSLIYSNHNRKTKSVLSTGGKQKVKCFTRD